MKTIFWLAILLFGTPFLISLLVSIYNVNSATEGIQKKSKVYIFEILGILLLVWSVIEMIYFGHNSTSTASFPISFFAMFPSVKAFVLTAVKFATGVAFIVLTILSAKGFKNRKNWSLRIEKALNGPLGEQLKNQLPNDSLYYYVGAHYEDCVVSFYNGETLERISFNSIGYENFPECYADIICKWIQEHIVLEKEMYRIEKAEKTTSHWSGGSSDYIETMRTSTGFESRYVSGDPGNEVIETYTLGYRLKHKNYLSSKQKQKLKTW